MHTRYSSLVTLKKNTMQSSERALQGANAILNRASMALQLSIDALEDVAPPENGTMATMLASRTLLDSQRAMIQHNKEWVEYSKKQVEQAKEQLKLDMIEYEKFNYLELEEVKKILQEQKVKEAKELDEVASMTFSRNNKGEER